MSRCSAQESNNFEFLIQTNENLNLIHLTSKNGKGSKLMQERLQILQEKQNEKYRLQITDLNESGTTGTRVEMWVPEEK